jgi:predicted RNA polymerase sigma factor
LSRAAGRLYRVTADLIRNPSSSSIAASRSYIIQAAIADLHLQHPRNWEQIALLYQRLEHITSSPVVTMNRAIAVAELEGPEAALALLDRLELDDYRYYHSTRADLLQRLGRNDEARAAYTRALEQTQPGPEQRFLESRLADRSESAEQQSDPEAQPISPSTNESASAPWPAELLYPR